MKIIFMFGFHVIAISLLSLTAGNAGESASGGTTQSETQSGPGDVDWEEITVRVRPRDRCPDPSSAFGISEYQEPFCVTPIGRIEPFDANQCAEWGGTMIDPYRTDWYGVVNTTVCDYVMAHLAHMQPPPCEPGCDDLGVSRSCGVMTTTAGGPMIAHGLTVRRCDPVAGGPTAP